ncbi:MAG: hypothetical protein LBF60_05795, partial [Treponema sp.]|nr:hypothetical protein [Treponema sp.]
MCEHEFSEPVVANLRFGLVLKQALIFISFSIHELLFDYLLSYIRFFKSIHFLILRILLIH